MKEIREWIREMESEEKKDVIESALSWAGLFWLMYMIAVIAG